MYPSTSHFFDFNLSNASSKDTFDSINNPHNLHLIQWVVVGLGLSEPPPVFPPVDPPVFPEFPPPVEPPVFPLVLPPDDPPVLLLVLPPVLGLELPLLLLLLLELLLELPLLVEELVVVFIFGFVVTTLFFCPVAGSVIISVFVSTFGSVATTVTLNS